MTISIDAERAFYKFQHDLVIKNSKQNRNRKEYLHLIKGSYEKSTCNMIFNGERINFFLLKDQE